MSAWPSTRARRVLAALLRAGWAVKRQSGSHRTLSHFKKIGRFWSVRVGAHYRALAVDAPDGLIWFWIGSHADYKFVHLLGLTLMGADHRFGAALRTDGYLIGLGSIRTRLEIPTQASVG